MPEVRRENPRSVKLSVPGDNSSSRASAPPPEPRRLGALAHVGRGCSAYPTKRGRPWASKASPHANGSEERRPGSSWPTPARATGIAVPCNTAHARLADLRTYTDVPVLDMLSASLEACRTLHPALKRIGILATEGTRASGPYDLAGERLDVQIVHVPPGQAELIPPSPTSNGGLARLGRRTTSLWPFTNSRRPGRRW
jgi:Asp/Glu/Hydantoin racemase